MVTYLAQHYLDHSQNVSPTQIAVRCAGSQMTYRKLYQSSNQLANSLRCNGISRQDRVALYLRRSPNCIIAIMGILKADAIYVPIDPKSPIARVMKIIDDCKPSALVCDTETVEQIIKVIPQMGYLPKIFVMEYRDRLSIPSCHSTIDQEQIERAVGTCPDYRNVDSDIACILYTSGSTGEPKGVMISHLNIVNYIEWAVDCFGINQQDQILNTAPFHFDMSTFDIYCSLKSGATLCIVPENLLLFPDRLLDLMEKEGITIWKGVSSLLMYIARSASLVRRRLPTLKKVLFGGESLPTKYLIEWMKAYPDKLFYNVYGPTEATGISAYYLVKDLSQDASEKIPIGRACGNTEVFLLKEDDSMAGIEEVGELCIRGSGISRGYWNDRAKTEEVFITNPLTQIPGDRVYRTGDMALLRKDGNYEFLGRKDTQVKYLGYRIDLSEIEHAIITLDNVRDASVILCPSETFCMSKLVAFVVAENGLDPQGILAGLSNKLPRYMLPQRVLLVKDIPRTDRGKIDRQTLGELLSNRDPQS